MTSLDRTAPDLDSSGKGFQKDRQQWKLYLGLYLASQGDSEVDRSAHFYTLCCSHWLGSALTPDVNLGRSPNSQPIFSTLKMGISNCAYFMIMNGFPGGASGNEPACTCRRHKRHEFDPWVGKIPWRRAWQPAPQFLPGESHGHRSLAGYSPGSQRVRHSWSD